MPPGGAAQIESEPQIDPASPPDRPQIEPKSTPGSAPNRPRVYKCKRTVMEIGAHLRNSGEDHLFGCVCGKNWDSFNLLTPRRGLFCASSFGQETRSLEISHPRAVLPPHCLWPRSVPHARRPSTGPADARMDPQRAAPTEWRSARASGDPAVQPDIVIAECVCLLLWRAQRLSKSCSGSRGSAQIRPKLADVGQVLGHGGQIWQTDGKA